MAKYITPLNFKEANWGRELAGLINVDIVMILAAQKRSSKSSSKSSLKKQLKKGAQKRSLKKELKKQLTRDLKEWATIPIPLISYGFPAPFLVSIYAASDRREIQ